jgi:multiple antibiotic resistance protein
MPPIDDLVTRLVLLWAVIDPIGTLPVFLSVTSHCSKSEKEGIARKAALVSGGILLFFILIGEVMLRAMGVSLEAFQIAGGIVLFLFALTMIFGESKPDSEIKLARSADDIAIFPLATPSVASPGAMMAVVLLTENDLHSVPDQMITAALMLVVIACVYGLMRSATLISNLIGSGGASIISRVMGLVLASIAASNVLEGIKLYYS